MSAFNDLSGKRFSKLVVKRRVEDKIRPSGERDVRYECVCDCGNTIIKYAHELQRYKPGKIMSCGCMKGVNHDYTGEKIGYLTVKNRIGIDKSNNVLWECVCDCGNTIIKSSKYLKTSEVHSCGCMSKHCGGKKTDESIIGQKIGKLTVVDIIRDRKNKNGKTITDCLCECECGERQIISRHWLMQKKDDAACHSCLSKGRHIDISGKKFGKLTALKPSNKRGNRGETFWICQCDCGNIFEASTCRLQNGSTKSCGCIVKNDGRVERILNNQRWYQRNREYEKQTGHKLLPNEHIISIDGDIENYNLSNMLVVNNVIYQALVRHHDLGLGEYTVTAALIEQLKNEIALKSKQLSDLTV